MHHKAKTIAWFLRLDEAEHPAEGCNPVEKLKAGARRACLRGSTETDGDTTD